MFKRIFGTSEPSSVSGVAYGLTITIEAPDKSMLERMRATLPEAWGETGAESSEPTSGPTMKFTLLRDTENGYYIELNDALLMQDPLDDMLELMPAVVRQYVAAETRDAVFVHAGAVGINGRGIVFPGRTFAGKSTLVAALLKAGALYYSDEYAVIRPDGLLIPYPKGLSLRLTDGERRQTEHTLTEVGGVPGTEPIEIALLVLTEYRAGSKWDPTELSPAQGVVELLAHAEPVQARPEMTLPAIKNGLANARVLKGQRGDADETAAALLAMLA
jgi:hypothetical protein